MADMLRKSRGGSPHHGKRRLAWVRAALLALFFGVFSASAFAEGDKRVAMVIGNGDYKVAPHLDNPVNDARAVAASFRHLGFQVTEGYDLNIAQMRATLSAFSESLVDSKAAVIYYAGHGVAIDDENYLLPVDIALKTPADLDLNAISVSLILRQMRRDERVNVVILDACRDNPFAADLARSKTRALIGERGLTAVDGDLVRGALIAFASDPRSVALDGRPGEHSPFTRALLDHLEDQGVPIDTVMSRVRSQVWESTGQRQLPWVNTSIIGEFDLNPAARPVVAAVAPTPATPVAPVAAPPSASTEDLVWESAQHSNLAADYQAYLDAFPSGTFAQMAHNRIAALSSPQTRTSLSPPEAPAAEVGSEETEKALALDPAGRKEVQQRLAALNYDAGPADGEFGDKARGAIRDWQKHASLTPTGWLAARQLASLRTESEAAWRRLLATQTASLPPATHPPARAMPTPHKAAAVKRRERPADVAAPPPPPVYTYGVNDPANAAAITSSFFFHHHF